MRLSSLAALALLAAAAAAPAAEASSSPFFSGLVSGLKSLLSSTDAAVSSALKKFSDFNALATAIATEADGNLTEPALSDPAAIGAFSQVALLDTPSTFTARQTASVNVNAAVAQYIFRDAFNATCPAPALNTICQHLADIAANSLNFLPSLFLFESVSAAAPAPVVNINATADQLLLDVRGSADAILNYVLFPAPSTSINKLFSLLGARVMPTASVTYAAASGAVFADLVHLLDVGANASSISVTQAFESILEYTDANGNGRYDRGEKIASTYDLYNRPFKPAVATNYTNPQGVVIRTVTSTTLDNVVTIACDVSASPVSSGSDQINIRAPSATGCSIKIANFPYASKSNLLALTGYVGSAIASAKGQGAALANITVYNTTDSALGYKTDLDLPLKAYAVWGAWAYAIPSVAANGTISDSAKAKAVFAAGFDLTDNANHLGLSARFTAFAKASARGSFTVRQFNFSLGDAAGSKQITWSNVIGVGTDALKAQAQASQAAPALFSGILALVPAIALAALSLL